MSEWNLPDWKLPWEIYDDDRAALRSSLEEQFRAGLVSSEHYLQRSAEIRDAKYRAELKAIGRSLPYEAQMARSAKLVKLATVVALVLLVSTAEFRWLLLIPGAFLAGGLVNFTVLRPLLREKGRAPSAARAARRPLMRPGETKPLDAGTPTPR